MNRSVRFVGRHRRRKGHQVPFTGIGSFGRPKVRCGLVGEVGSLLTPISNKKSTTTEMNTNRYAPFGGKCTVWWYGLAIFLVWKSYGGFLYNSKTCLCVSCLIDSLLTRGLKNSAKHNSQRFYSFFIITTFPFPTKVSLFLSLSLCVFNVQFLYSILKLYNISALDTLSATTIFILFHLTKLCLK